MSAARRRGFFARLACALFAASAGAALAQGALPPGKNIQLLIGAGSGGGYDLTARMIARFMPKHLPGAPTIVPQNMPAGGGIALANHLWSAAARDGTVIGTVPREIATAPFMGNSAARYEPAKLSWIGTPTSETNTCLTRADTAIRDYKDLYEKTLIVGDAGAGNGIHMYPIALNNIFGMKFRLVPGYSTSAEIFLAIERGEVDGICVSYDSVLERYSEWLSSGKIRILLQGGAAKNPLLPDTPFVMDLARDDDERQLLKFLYAGQGIGRPYAAPPGLPEASLATLRRAFDATMADPDFIAEAKRAKLRLDPMPGEKLAALVADLAATPPAVRDRVRGFLE